MQALKASCAMLLCTVSSAFAEPELVTDRPDQTESSVVVPPGRVQLEVGWTTTREDEQGLLVETDELLSSLVRIGLAERVELRVGWAGFVSEETEMGAVETEVDGPGDAELGTKIYLSSERGKAPEVALLVGASLPTGDDALTSDRVDPSFRFSLSHTLSERVGIGYNLGASWSSELDEGGERDTLSSYIYTLAVGVGVSERLGVFAELFGELSASASGPPAHSFDGGLTYLLRPNLQLDVAGGLGLSDSADDWFVGLGLSARLPR